MYSTGSAVGSTQSSRSAFSPISLLIFTGSKSVKFGLDIDTTLFELPSFSNEATHRYCIVAKVIANELDKFCILVLHIKKYFKVFYI